ncbi:MAG: SusC/RagA family TonB-linked outer membrane protein [Bacteroidales bacterium]|nr:SusC/RagA family TonB-linked outer membrane protein [Bacteroidales bacterium]
MIKRKWSHKISFILKLISFFLQMAVMVIPARGLSQVTVCAPFVYHNTLADHSDVTGMRNSVEANQQQVVRGTVLNGDSGKPLGGVSVLIRGTTSGTITGEDGSFAVTIASDARMLIFSLEGYQKQEIVVSGRSVVNVIMVEETRDLNKMVITGYAPERKKDITGSVSLVNTASMLRTPSAFTSVQLQGRTAGVNVSSEGSVSGLPEVRIRGFGSFGSCDPLYIIDGIPGDIGRLNPNDIETVQVLKDASSAAIYGGRAAGGVIVITTNRGVAGPLKLDVNYYFGINYVSKNDFPDLLDAEEWGDLYWLQMEGAGRTYDDGNWWHPQYGNGPEPLIPEYILVNDNGSRTGGTILESLRISDPELFAEYVDPENYDFATHQIVKAGNTDWFGEVYNPASMHNLQINISGGKERVQYLMSGNFFDRDHVADRYTFFRRYTLRSNAAFNGSRISFGENIQVSYSEGRNAGNGNAWNMPSLCPVYDIARNPASSAAPGIISTGMGNPVTNAWRNRFDGDYYYGVFGNAFVDVTLLRGVIFHSSIGMNHLSGINKNYTMATYEHAENYPAPSILSKNWGHHTNWIFTNTLNYSKTSGFHNVKILLGTEYLDTYVQDLNSAREAYEIDDEARKDAIIQATTGTYFDHSWFSIFGRVDYNFSGKYLINVTLRSDRPSGPEDDNKYHYFPAVAAGWRISGERLMENLTWLNDLKLRAGHGVTGNLNAIMEKVISTNLGLDATLLAGNISMNFDYYIKRSKDLLVGSPTAEPLIYTGEMQNRGVDATFTWRGKIAGELGYEVAADFSAYKNEVLKLTENPSSAIAGGGTRMGYVTLTKQGYPVSMFYGYRIEGFFNSQAEVDAYNAATMNTWLPPAEGRWKIEDVNGDHVINDNDRTYIGDPHPDFQVGFYVFLTYRNLDLSGFIFWNQGGDIFNLIRYNIDFNTFQYNRSTRMLYESWTPENTNARLPKHDLNDLYSNKYATDYFVEDATYIRLKQLQIGYTLPSELTNRFNVRSLRIYLQTENIWTYIKDHTGLDPGISISGPGGSSMGIYNGGDPAPKQIIFGLNMSF